MTQLRSTFPGCLRGLCQPPPAPRCSPLGRSAKKREASGWHGPPQGPGPGDHSPGQPRSAPVQCRGARKQTARPHGKATARRDRGAISSEPVCRATAARGRRETTPAPCRAAAKVRGPLRSRAHTRVFLLLRSTVRTPHRWRDTTA